MTSGSTTNTRLRKQKFKRCHREKKGQSIIQLTPLHQQTEGSYKYQEGESSIHSNNSVMNYKMAKGPGCLVRPPEGLSMYKLYL